MNKLIAIKNRFICWGINFLNPVKDNSLTSDPGEGYVDTMVKVIIAIVIGGLLLAFFTKIYNDNVFPTVTTKITEMFGG